MYHSAIIVILVGIYTACVTTPETKRRQLNFIPDGQMNAMGQQAYAEILKTEKLSRNRPLTDQIVKIGKRIARASGKNFKWEFKLIESKTVNAFCLPGGKVAFYTGILPIAANEGGVAAIMGHEVAHAVLRHGAERVSQQLVVQGGVAIAALSFQNSKYRNVIAASLGLGAQFGVMLPFSRKHESEADMVGLEYMAKAGYEPREAVELWKRMAKQGGRPPELLSTHPDPLRRSRDLEKRLSKVNKYYAKSQKQAAAKLKI